SSNLGSSPSILQPLKSPRPLFLTISKTLSRISGTQAKPPQKKTSTDGPKIPTRRNPRRSKYGTSRKSILKKTLSQEQVMFTAPVSDDPVVGIIGGGISGLVCALYLEKRGIRSTVFDTVGQFFRFDCLNGNS
ncbi:unnamed protein product, partial [Ilex paraguariensis]